jgi:hypothetical protein
MIVVLFFAATRLGGLGYLAAARRGGRLLDMWENKKARS